MSSDGDQRDATAIVAATTAVAVAATAAASIAESGVNTLSAENYEKMVQLDNAINKFNEIMASAAVGDNATTSSRSKDGTSPGKSNSVYDFCLDELPEKNKFWRDGEEVFTDDGPNGLSIDFRVRLVYLNIMKTLELFASSSDVDSGVAGCRKLKEFLRYLRYEKKRKPITDTVQIAGRVMSNMRDLILAVDTSKGARKLIVNQMDPFSCRVSPDHLRKLCKFCDFGEFNEKYGTLTCKFFLPIKLVFLGNLETKLINNQDNVLAGDIVNTDQGYTVYNVEVSHHFGSHFYDFLENLYDVCFEMLEKELHMYKEDSTLKSKRHESLLGLLQLRNDNTQPLLTTAALCNTAGPALLDNLDGFNRHKNFKIAGTAGKMNQETRLRYVRYDKASNTVVEDDPVEEADAVFVSSYIGMRINTNGTVYMDVYARQALLLELYNDDIDVITM